MMENRPRYFISDPKTTEQMALTTPKQIITYPIWWIPRAHETYACELDLLEMASCTSRFTYLSKISTNESLLHSNEDCQRNQKLLVRFFQLLESCRKKFNPRKLLSRNWTSSSLTVSWKWIHEQANDDDGCQNTCQIDGRNRVNFWIWRSLQVGVVSCFNNAEVGSAELKRGIRIVPSVTTPWTVCTWRQHQARDQISPKFSRLPSCAERKKNSKKVCFQKF